MLLHRDLKCASPKGNNVERRWSNSIRSHRVIILADFMLKLFDVPSSISSLNSSADWFRRYQISTLKFRWNWWISAYLQGHPFSLGQTPKDYSIMLGLFSVKVSSFDTVRLLKCFVVNFTNLGWDFRWTNSCVPIALWSTSSKFHLLGWTDQEVVSEEVFNKIANRES